MHRELEGKSRTAHIQEKSKTVLLEEAETLEKSQKSQKSQKSLPIN
jgi:hypothetical protein